MCDPKGNFGVFNSVGCNLWSLIWKLFVGGFCLGRIVTCL